MKMLIAVDGSKYAAEGLRVAAHHARTCGTKATIHVMNVIPSVADIDLELSASERDRILESMKQRGESILERARDQLKQYGVADVTSVLATAPSPATEIISFAEKERVDLIVIGSRGRGANGRFFLGSVAANVVRHSPCCVYVVREPHWL